MNYVSLSNLCVSYKYEKMQDRYYNKRWDNYRFWIRRSSWRPSAFIDFNSTAYGYQAIKFSLNITLTYSKS